jgi:hypothetical protein
MARLLGRSADSSGFERELAIKFICRRTRGSIDVEQPPFLCGIFRRRGAYHKSTEEPTGLTRIRANGDERDRTANLLVAIQRVIRRKLSRQTGYVEPYCSLHFSLH